MEVNDLMATAWFPELAAEVRHELARLGEQDQDPRPAWEKERRELHAKVAGWSQSLAKPDLNPSVRLVIEADLEKALARVSEIEIACDRHAKRQCQIEALLDPEEVLKQLNRLDGVLAANNPTAGNLELSLHVDRIDCFSDGKVVMRTCKLGALAGAVDILSVADTPALDPQPVEASQAVKRAKPRRRAKLRTDPLAADASSQKAAAHMAADPERFAGLDDQWFWEDVFWIPAKTCWAQEHAAEVAQMRASGLTMAALAFHFGKTVPTIRDAFRRAGLADPSTTELPKKMPRRRWAVDNALEVAKLKQQGVSTNEIAKRLGKSDTTIREALRIAEASASSGNSEPSNSRSLDNPTEAKEGRPSPFS